MQNGNSASLTVFSSVYALFQILFYVECHTRWLVFEAESRLQIRPKQYEVARHMFTHSGNVVQLNMGENPDTLSSSRP